MSSKEDLEIVSTVDRWEQQLLEVKKKFYRDLLSHITGGMLVVLLGGTVGGFMYLASVKDRQARAQTHEVIDTCVQAIGSHDCIDIRASRMYPLDTFRAPFARCVEALGHEKCSRLLKD